MMWMAEAQEAKERSEVRITSGDRNENLMMGDMAISDDIDRYWCCCLDYGVAQPAFRSSRSPERFRDRL